MVTKLFKGKSPGPATRILDPGCGTGAFVDGIIRWCKRRHQPVPPIVAIELDPDRASIAQEKFRDNPAIEIRCEDFLVQRSESYEFIIGNPPYVPITDLTEREKTRLRRRYTTAYNRFDLYMMFFEQSVRLLAPGGRLVFITPEKFLYVDTAAPLRRLLAAHQVEEIELVHEETFGDLVTYPTITVISKVPPSASTRTLLRNGREREVGLSSDGSSWMPLLQGSQNGLPKHTLGDICQRISCGVATGSDSVFVMDSEDVPADLVRFAYPTISGRDITPKTQEPKPHASMLVPYHRNGALMTESELGPLRVYLRKPENEEKLLKRTCVKRKPWYAFHETPQLNDMLRPKILLKDITEQPTFVLDRDGTIVPRHSVYYIVPKDPSGVQEILAYLRSADANKWLRNHCQRAANGYLRVQTQVLKRLPIPERLAQTDSEDANRTPARRVIAATAPDGV